MLNLFNDETNYITCSFCHCNFTVKYYYLTHCRDYPSGGCASNGGVRLSDISLECEQDPQSCQTATPTEQLSVPHFNAASPHHPDRDAQPLASPDDTENDHYLEEQEYQVAHAESTERRLQIS